MFNLNVYRHDLVMGMALEDTPWGEKQLKKIQGNGSP